MFDRGDILELFEGVAVVFFDGVVVGGAPFTLGIAGF
jgi:hypothetical protein